MDKTLFDRLELVLPAPWVDHDGRDFAGEVKRILHFAVEQFNDALVACAVFEPFAEGGNALEAWGRCDRMKERLRGLYARAYVYALNATRAFVYLLSNRSGIPPAAESACAAFLLRFGQIRDIRNSLQHVQERAQGKGSFGKRLPHGLFLLGAFIGRRFGITASDGQQIEVGSRNSSLPVSGPPSLRSSGHSNDSGRQRASNAT